MMYCFLKCIYSKKRFFLCGFICICSILSNAQNYNSFYEKGTQEFDKRNYFAAAVYFKQSHELAPEITAISYKLAEALINAHAYEKALEIFTDIINKKSEKYPLAYYYQAVLQKTLGQYDNAVSSFRFYSKHTNSNDPFHQESITEAQLCESALASQKTNNPIIYKLQKKINSIFSETSISEYEDSVLIYSKLTPNNDTTAFLARVFSNKHIYKYDNLVQTINSLNTNVSDICLSPDKKIAYFSSSIDSIGISSSKIYSTQFDSLRWTTPIELLEPINISGTNNTQPYLANINGKTYLFFVSNRPNGFGKLDIWYSIYENHTFTNAINLGPEINSEGDDVTPFYDTLTHCLYFSSDSRKGFGGLDIFSNHGYPLKWSKSQNLGHDINSSFNECYFNISQNHKRSYFTSNRSPISIDDTHYYFNDYYFFYNNELLNDLKDTIAQEKRKASNPIIDSVVTEKYTLYFDIGQPSHTDNKTYVSLLDDYRKKIKSLHEKELNTFFNQTVEKDMHLFTQTLKNIKPNQQIEIELQAYTSPTGNMQTNTQIADNRILIIKKYLMASFSQNKNLSIIVLPNIITQFQSNNQTTTNALLQKVEIKITKK